MLAKSFGSVHSYNEAGTNHSETRFAMLTAVASPRSCSTTFWPFISSRRHCYHLDLSQADRTSRPEFVLSIIIPCVIAEFTFKLHGGFG